MDDPRALPVDDDDLVHVCYVTQWDKKKVDIFMCVKWMFHNITNCSCMYSMFLVYMGGHLEHFKAVPFRVIGSYLKTQVFAVPSSNVHGCRLPLLKKYHN